MSAEVARVPDEQDEALGRLAQVLAADAGRAAELLGEVTVLDRRTPLVTDDRYEDRRTLLVQRVLRRRPPPAVPADPVEQRGVEDRLARLDPLTRTLLVLRHGEHLTLAELARITDRSPAAVARALEQAEGAAPASDPPRIEPYEVEQALWRAEPPEPGAVREAERRFAARRRRTRTRVVLAGLAVVALVAGLSVVPGLLRTGPYVRGYGEWTQTLSLAPDAPFRVEGRQLSADEEVLGLISSAEEDQTCSITLTTARDRVARPPGRAATLGDRPARFVDATPDRDAGLWWSVGPVTSAFLQCDAVSDDATLLDVAGLARFGRDPAELPFDLRGLPPEREVHTLFEYSEGVGALVVPRGETEESDDALVLTLATDGAIDTEGTVTDVRGEKAWLSDDEESPSICWRPQRRNVCVLSFGDSDSSAEQIRRTGLVLRTARQIRLVPDLDDRRTWLDARDALPG